MRWQLDWEVSRAAADKRRRQAARLEAAQGQPGQAARQRGKKNPDRNVADCATALAG